MLGPRPSAVVAPSIWNEAVAAPQRKPSGNSLRLLTASVRTLHDEGISLWERSHNRSRPLSWCQHNYCPPKFNRYPDRTPVGHPSPCSQKGEPFHGASAQGEGQHRRTTLVQGYHHHQQVTEALYTHHTQPQTR